MLHRVARRPDVRASAGIGRARRKIVKGVSMGILIVLALILLPVAVHAISHNTPESYGLSTYCWVIMTALAGGFASLMGRLRKLSWLEMCGELIVSAFAGVITFWLCEFVELNQLASAALVGIVGHMGSRGMTTLERIGLRILKGRLHVTVEEKNDE